MKAKFILLAALVPVFAAQASVFEIHALDPKSSSKTKVYTIENAGRKRAVNLNNDILIDRRALVGAHSTVESISVATAGKAEQRPVAGLKVTFTRDGLGKFTDITTALVGRQVGVLVDGKLIATPAVREPQRRSSITLTGNFTKEEADALAAKINSGK